MWDNVILSDSAACVLTSFLIFADVLTKEPLQRTGSVVAISKMQGEGMDPLSMAPAIENFWLFQVQKRGQGG